MIGGKKCKTLKEAKLYQTNHKGTDIYHLKGKTYKYFVGTNIQWLNL